MAKAKPKWLRQVIYMAANHRPSVEEVEKHRECWFDTADKAEYAALAISRNYTVYAIHLRMEITTIRVQRAPRRRKAKK